MSDLLYTESGRKLAAQILEHITAHPEQHDQLSFGEKNDCGTTACIAGWAALLTDNAFFRKKFEDDESYGWRLVVKPDAEYSFESLGANLLGMEYDDAWELFYCLDNEQAKAALGYVARGEEIDWYNIREGLD